MRLALSILLLLVVTGAASAQNSGAPGLSSSASGALETLRDVAKDRLMVADMLGAKVTTPSGDTAGTIRNLVAVPGGRLVAVILELSDGQKLAVPYDIMKVSSASDTLDLSIPMGVEALTGSQAVKEVSSLLGF